MMNHFKTPKGTELPVMNMRGKDYLEVKYRLVWFREEHPDWGINTELVSMTTDSCLARATIWNERGQIMSTSHKFEDKKGFADFIEKAETGAIGRALALVGYGTQFCGDELDEDHRIVDAPAKRTTAPLRALTQAGPYTPKTGKFAGQVLKDCDMSEVATYVTFLEDGAKRIGKPMPPAYAEFILEAKKLLAQGEAVTCDQRG